MKCTDCKGDLTFERVVAPYSDNLPGVIVDGLEHGTCAGCGHVYRAIPRLRELHALVVGAILGKAWRLAPEEVRWVRLSMGMKADELAKTLGVTASQISRWETGASPISALADRLLRMIAASFHRVPAPELARIDGDRADRLEVRIELAKRWRLAPALKHKAA